MTKDEIDNALRSWHTINKALKTMSEQDCKAAMERELVGNRRKGYCGSRAPGVQPTAPEP